MADDQDRITRQGKQIMMDGEHLADARDDTAAEIIMLALTWAGVADIDLPRDVDRKFSEFLA